MAAGDDPRRQVQRDLEEAYRRGQIDQMVQTLQNNILDIRSALRDIQESVSSLSKNTVMRPEFDALESRVEGLTKWQWTLAGGLGVLMALSQILPRLIDALTKGP